MQYDTPTLLYKKTDLAAARRILQTTPGAMLVDVRTEAEYLEGHEENAVLFPLEEICAETAAKIIPSHFTPVLLYCSRGVRSASAAGRLLRLGYRRVYDVGAVN